MRNINYAFLPPGSLPRDVKHIIPDKPVECSELDNVIKLVYAVDERTKLPSSDLNILVSDSVPSEIADWVRRNLFKEIPSVDSSIINGEQVDDETLRRLTRSPYESNAMYINRANDVIRSLYVKKEGD